MLVTLVLLMELLGYAHAGDLAGAGALSGAGQAMTNSLSTMQSAIIQQGLMQERARQEQALMEAQFRYQQQLEEQRRQYKREQIRQQQAAPTLTQELDRLYPQWRKIYGDGKAYRQWISTQPKTYQELMRDTTDPRVLWVSIDQFQQHIQQTAQPSTREENIDSSSSKLEGVPQPSSKGFSEKQLSPIANSRESEVQHQRQKELFLLWNEHRRLESQRVKFEALTNQEERQAAMFQHNAQVVAYEERLNRYRQSAP